MELITRSSSILVGLMPAEVVELELGANIVALEVEVVEEEVVLVDVELEDDCDDTAVAVATNAAAAA